jgi:hypothetical protein
VLLPPLDGGYPSASTVRRNYQQSLNIKKLKNLAKRLDDQEIQIQQGKAGEWSIKNDLEHAT